MYKNKKLYESIFMMESAHKKIIIYRDCTYLKNNNWQKDILTDSIPYIVAFCLSWRSPHQPTRSPSSL